MKLFKKFHSGWVGPGDRDWIAWGYIPDYGAKFFRVGSLQINWLDPIR